MSVVGVRASVLDGGVRAMCVGSVLCSGVGVRVKCAGWCACRVYVSGGARASVLGGAVSVAVRIKCAEGWCTYHVYVDGAL